MAGSYVCELVDRENFLTSILRWDSDPVTDLASDIDGPLVDSFFVRRYPYLEIGQVAYCGAEAMLVTNVVGNDVFVTRGFLGTDRCNHYDYDPVRLYTGRLEGKRLDLFAWPFDADDDEECLRLDSFSVMKVDWSEDWTTLRLQCGSRLLGLKRTVGARARSYYQITHVVGYRTLSLRGLAGAESPASPWPDEPSYYVLDGKEVISGFGGGLGGGNAAFIGQIQILDRAKFGTSPIDLQSDVAYSGPGPSVRAPLFAETQDGIGSFRLSPSGATARDAGDIEQSPHFVDIIYNLWTGSRVASDGLECVNFTEGYPNWSFLQPGWGAGIRASEIDFDAGLEVKARTPDFKFPGFRLDAPGNLGEVIAKNFLRPLGAFVVTKNGKLAITLPRLPFAGGPSLPSFDHSNILRRPRARRAYTAGVTGGYNQSAQIRAINFRITGPNLQPVSVLLAVGDFVGELGQREAANDADDILTLEVPGLRYDQEGLQTILEELAVRTLIRRANPPLALDLDIDLEMHETTPGSAARFSSSIVPNTKTGVRGVSNQTVLVLERAWNLAEKPPGLRFSVESYGPEVVAGLIAPAAAVSIWDSGSNTATLPQRYTDGAATGGLPTTEGAQFAVGQRWKVIHQDGTRASPASGAPGSYQTVTDVDGNDVTFDGDWDGLDPTDLILVLADYDDARTDEREIYVADSDRLTRTVGSSSRPPWGFAES